MFIYGFMRVFLMKNIAQFYYKPQGQVLAEIGTNQGLGEHDFALVILTPLQSEMLMSCGHNKIVCVDATHGTNSYNFFTNNCFSDG